MAKKSPQSILKAKGLIPKNWDLRKLTDYKKRIIKKRAAEYAEVIKHPEKFQSRKYSKEKASKLLDAGYSGVGQHILIPKRGENPGKTIVKGNTLRIDRGNRIETVYLSNGPDFLNRLQRMLDREAGSDEDPEFEPHPNRFWALKVGDNNTFLKMQGSLRELMRYGETLNLSSPEARNFVHLVRVDYKESPFRQLPYNPSNPTEPKKRARKPKWQNKRGK